MFLRTTITEAGPLNLEADGKRTALDGSLYFRLSLSCMDDPAESLPQEEPRIPRRTGSLRREISFRNQMRAEHLEHELTYGEIPSVIYSQDEAGGHGNFLPASYRRICAAEDWRKRLDKVYTASRSVPRAQDRLRKELDCANSSDALLMNVFCYPGVMNRLAVYSMLGVAKGERPCFGFRPMTPLHDGKTDRTEVDMKLGELLIEAKLTEGDFQSARFDLIERYRDFREVFDVESIPVRRGSVSSYQLIRGVLAAFATGCSFCVLCDARRPDLIEDWYRIARAVQSAELRARLRVLTWQELAACLVPAQQRFLREKYGIEKAI